MPTPKNMYEHACSRVGWGGEGDWDMAIVGGTHELRESVRARVRERARARGHTCSRMVGSVHGEEPETAVDELAFLVGGALGGTVPLISSTSFMKHSEKKKPRSCQHGQVRVP